MTDQTNDFDLFVALVLAKLYETRGTRPTLDATDFGLGAIIDLVAVDHDRVVV